MPSFMTSIHVGSNIIYRKKTWIAGTSQAMTVGVRSVKALVIAIAVASLRLGSHRRELARRFCLSARRRPSIMQDIRYAGPNNFVGRPLAGYEAAECVVTRDVGLALARVRRELAPRKLLLKMLDCYRPARAVHDTTRWYGRGTAGRRRPSGGIIRLSAKLFRLCYIAEHSGHSTGVAVDLTLVDLTAGSSAAYGPSTAYADCTAPASERASEASVDMGTGYDCSDDKARTAARSITPDQRRWRNLLVAAMARQGFVNYSKEWWHFSLPGAAGPAYDFLITARHN
jgi:D-alanyl-D-alanine dipeptidase